MSDQYGPILRTDAAEKFAIEVFQTSRKEKAEGRKGLPVCAWGPAGIGKTELPNLLVKKYSDMFDGNIVYLPMAQIEEKAELQGLPELYENERPLLDSEDEEKVNGLVKTIEDPNAPGGLRKVVVESRTVYATPSWIPQEDTHGKRGLLVIDDMNRADARIINSIMQLLQDGKLLGWSLPEEWEIYCTCNPDDGHYQVTPFDGAQMTRMVNFRQEFDAKSWLSDWAIPTGIHPIAQNFVMTHPEDVCKGERTNPRSFDKFFRLVAPALDSITEQGVETGKGSEVVKLLQNYGLMNIDATSLSVFLSFITNGFGRLPNIEELLDPDFDLDKLYEKLTQHGQVRIDIISSLDCRIILHVQQNSDNTKYRKGLRKWLKHPKLPAELRYKSLEAVIKEDAGVSDAELAEIIFSRYS